MIFYLDDYNLISVKKNNELANVSLDIFKDNKRIDYELENDEKYLLIHLKEDYDETDFKILINDTIQDLVPRFITHTKRFDEDYKVDLNLLGSFIEDNKTIFRLWAPLSKDAFVVADNQEYKMDYKGRGLFELIINDNLDTRIYHYKVIREKAYEFSDPFSYLNKNENESYVLDIRRFNKDKIKPEPFKNVSIYEISVRDFSSDKRIDFTYPKKFLGLIEEGLKLDEKEVGFDYLKQLGVSHVQMLPVFSFDLDKSDYNWGYNPTSFNSLEHSYFVSDDPYEELNEFKKVVDTYHKNNIYVSLDVVYNHVYRVNDFNLEKMLPYYFFRYKKDVIGNASFCGNETRSEGYFLSEYLKLLCGRFVDVYDIDALRFDIMGILDVDTINGIKDICANKKPYFLVYGEGWNMGDILSDDKKATMDNALTLKDVGFFNDRFRNTLRGKEIDDDNAYLLGKIELKEKVKELLKGSLDMGFEANQSVNYIECHDNYTLFDKLSKYEKEIDIIKVTKLALALTVLSRGLAFIHSGIEFLRTKKGIDNSYNKPDEINLLDWDRKNKYINVSKYLKDLLKLKDILSSYFDENKEITFEEYYEILIVRIDDLMIFINPCVFDHIYCADNNIHIIFDESGFKDEDDDKFKISAFSILVGYKR